MPLTLITFLLFTGLVAFITWWMVRGKADGSSSGYFLAGRSLTGGFIAGSLLLTNLSAEQLVGLNGNAFLDGMSVMAWEVIAGLCLVLMALFFLPRYLKSGISTVPEYLEKRFGPSTRAITSFIFILAYALVLLPVVLYTGARGLIDILDLQSLLGLESDTQALWLTVWVIGIIGSIYAIFGGLRSVAISDTLNGLGLLIGGLLITWFGLHAVNEGGVFAALGEMKEAHPEKFNSLGSKDQSVPFSTLFTGVLLLNLFYWCTNQQIIQRTFGAKNLAEGQKGVLIAGFFKVLAPLILVLPGIIAFHLYSAENPDMNKDFVYGTLVNDVLPKPLVGFFAAVLVGAVLSSFNSGLNSTATLFSLGVYQKMIKQGQASDQQSIAMGKIFGSVVALLAMCLAPFIAQQKGVFDFLQAMNSIYFIPIFSVVIIGMLHRRVPTFAANSALIGGVVIIALGQFVPYLKETIVEPMNGFHFIGAVFALLIGFLLLAARLKPTAPIQLPDVKAVDLTPWRLAKPVGIAIVVFVLFIYGSLADFSVLSEAKGE